MSKRNFFSEEREEVLYPILTAFFARLLEVTIDNLEQSRSLVVEGTADGGPMTARFADLCEELARAVTSLLALQVIGLKKPANNCREIYFLTCEWLLLNGVKIPREKK
jgi:hypothetical protein